MTWEELQKELQKSKAGNAYIRLISEARKNVPENSAVEVHHIVPKSLRGSDESTNLVTLTVFDHIKAHYFLAKALGDRKRSTLKAFDCMCQMHFSKVSEMDQITLEQLEGWGKLRAKSRKHSEETKKKISEATKGKRKVRIQPTSQETREKISRAKKGKQLSLDHRENISKAKKGTRGAFTGKRHTEFSRKKMSLSHLGKPGNFTGKHHSEETKIRMREAHLGKKLTEEDKQKKSEAQKRRWERYKNSK